MSSPLTLLIVAADPLMRAGLAALMDALPDCTVVGQLADTDLASPISDELIKESSIVLWDMGWDEAADELLDLVPELPPVVALVSDEEQASVALSAGCRGVIDRLRDERLMFAVLQVAAAGLLVVTETLLTDRVAAAERDNGELVDDLTAREMQVLRLVAEGLTNRAIAHQLTISEHTVKFHLNAVMSKLDAQSRTEAVVRATRLGLISL